MSRLKVPFSGRKRATVKAESAPEGVVAQRLQGRRVPAHWERGIRVVLIILLLIAAVAWFADWRQDRADARAQEAATTAASSMTDLLTFGSTSALSDLDKEASLLTEEFADEYIPQVREQLTQAQDSGLKVTANAEVQRTGVIKSDGDQVVVLMFVSVTRTVEGTADVNVIQPKLRVTMQHEDGEWKVAGSDSL